MIIGAFVKMNQSPFTYKLQLLLIMAVCIPFILLCFHDAAAFESPKQHSYLRPGTRLLKTTASGEPYVSVAVHNINNVNLTVTNIGQFGLGYLGVQSDPLSGNQAPSCYFPTNSQIEHLYVGGFWIGAIVGRDTLVSIGVDDYYNVVEFWPAPYPYGEIEYRSIEPSHYFYHPEAKSEQDIIAVYADTLTDASYVSTDRYDGRPHRPLNIEVIQRSYAWSYSYASDFLLFDYSIKNIGRRDLDKVYMAIYVDGDVHHESNFGSGGYEDDICGFRVDHPVESPCDFRDTINVAYIMDNDGDPDESGNFTTTSCRSVAGVRVVRTPSDSLEYSFNWWITNYSSAALDFGPRKTGTPEHPFRDMSGVLGTPLGDRNKYYIMQNKEFDYDQMFTAKDHTAGGWLPPPASATDYANGFDARFLLSFGPFNLSPGEVLPVSFAYICAAAFHAEPDNFKNLFNPLQPETFYNSLNFDSMAYNSRWASFIYDNPNYDSNGDKYFGKYRICCLDTTLEINDQVFPPETTIIYGSCDTTWYEGDGVPDFVGAQPPPAPVLRVFPEVDYLNRGRLIIRWNGFASEMTPDRFSGDLDFEGFRVMYSMTPRMQDFVLLNTYDREDYNRWTYVRNHQAWELLDIPFTMDQLKAMYRDGFDPLVHSVDNPLWVSNPSGEDSIFYFTRQDWNQSNLLDTFFIHKVFPDQPFPTVLDLDSAALYYPEELTEDGQFKYFEYKYILRDLLPSLMYYVTVTAFDYGSPRSGLTSLESSPLINMVAEYPQNSAPMVEEKGLDVIVYPNPYRIDANYRAMGLEGAVNVSLPPERTRAIHFANLPHKCTIRIFTLDGDLVRQIEHDVPPGDPRAMHETWDLITRNTQAIVSGIYYYSVESAMGNQLGKIVIIL
jgi:hypothetical protein